MNPDNTNNPSADRQTVQVELPATLDDLSVVQILDILQALTRAIESQYADHLYRYYDPPDEHQYPLFDDVDEGDIPF